MMQEFLGYRRENGEVGVRNHVAVLSAMDNCNGIVKKISSQVRYVLPITVWYGRTQYSDDGDLTYFNSLVGLMQNPNIHSVLVVSLESVSAKKLCTAISEKTGKRALYIAVQEEGNSISAVAKGVEICTNLISIASEVKLEKFDLSYLTIGVECGGSDTSSGLSANPALGKIADIVINAGGKVILSETSEILGAEHILAKRAINDRVKEKLLSIVRNIEMETVKNGINISEINPSPDNKAGGLTTLEEKSLGAIIKGGSSPLQDVIEFGETPKEPGFFVMDTPSPATESMTGLSAGGAQIILFATGKGNIIGSPISPTIKVTGNPNTVEYFGPNIDFDVSSVFLGQQTLDDIIEGLLDFMIKVASGKKTRSEILGDEEIVLKPVPLVI
ncbi:UxaA family hydrolase [Cytobacillus dafuensis]|uniref:Altronate hydrolase n=1 Tax=Cytobacillus dafuensis TaxID=1742359 RepID=A0A5B8Z4A0_CYTDA|nr:UxaA family hydrolase [Cytobacillus dafuensis]QED47930.1 altronate hydrolase [Cytobacillus dafuensis]